MNYLACNPANYTKGYNRKIKYLVVHYVGALGDAEANAHYFATGKRGASAHYFVGFAGDVWQSVKDEDVAWHCGGDLQGSGGHKFFKKCTNSNSIGIELCVHKKDPTHLSGDDKDWYFEEATLKAAADLVKQLMKKYKVPIGNVIRHYDVTGKICPAPFVYDEKAWAKFKKRLDEEELDMTKEELLSVAGTGDHPSSWAKEATEWAKKEGIFGGDGDGNYGWQQPITREAVAAILYRYEHK